MSSIENLNTRIDRALAQVEQQRSPRPRLIDCTGARERLLARLQNQATGASEQNQDTSAHDANVLEQLRAALQQGVQDIEQRFNVRLVSERSI